MVGTKMDFDGRRNKNVSNTNVSSVHIQNIRRISTTDSRA